MPYLALFAIVFGINLLPAFGPPTWAVLVFTRHYHRARFGEMAEDAKRLPQLFEEVEAAARG